MKQFEVEIRTTGDINLVDSVEFQFYDGSVHSSEPEKKTDHLAAQFPFNDLCDMRILTISLVSDNFGSLSSSKSSLKNIIQYPGKFAKNILKKFRATIDFIRHKRFKLRINGLKTQKIKSYVTH